MYIYTIYIYTPKWYIHMITIYEQCIYINSWSLWTEAWWDDRKLAWGLKWNHHSHGFPHKEKCLFWKRIFGANHCTGGRKGLPMVCRTLAPLFVRSRSTNFVRMVVSNMKQIHSKVCGSAMFCLWSKHDVIWCNRSPCRRRFGSSYITQASITEAKDLRFSAQGKAGDENAAGPIVAYLVGGLEHGLFSIRYGIILPIDFHIFQDG